MLIYSLVFKEKLGVFGVDEVETDRGERKADNHFVLEFRRLGTHTAEEIEELIDVASMENTSRGNLVDAIF